MDIKIGKAYGRETPASEISEYVLEHVAALMALGGIESISAVKYQCGIGSSLHVSIAPFADAPSDVTAQGIVIKDALAQILSVANVVRVMIEPSDDDMKKITKMWKDSTRDARLHNGGSSDFTIGSQESGEQDAGNEDDDR